MLVVKNTEARKQSESKTFEEKKKKKKGIIIPTINC